MTAAFPLSWPQGWPRTPEHRRKGLGGTGAKLDWNSILSRLSDEMERLGATNLVLSTNNPTRLDGRPYGNTGNPDDPGAAVYFVRKQRSLVIAQDRHILLIDNIRSIAIGIEHLRGLERHGGGSMMDRAFAGFEELPAPGGHQKRTWRQVFGIEATNVTVSQAETTFRALARQHHPDKGGTQGAMAELNQAMEEARRELQQ